MKRKLLILLAACLILTFVPATFVGTAALEADRDFACACSMQSYSGDYKNIVYYGATSVVRMSAEQATQNNVPAGYSGDVIYVENQTKDALGTGIMLDFSSLNIKIEDLRSITFRVYVETDGTTNDGYPEFRIIKPNPKSSETPSGWVMRYDASQQTDQWIEITLGADGLNFLSGASFASLALDGYLNKFELGVRAHAKVLDFYIDSISYKVYSLDDGEEFACE